MTDKDFDYTLEGAIKHIEKLLSDGHKKHEYWRYNKFLVTLLSWLKELEMRR